MMAIRSPRATRIWGLQLIAFQILLLSRSCIGFGLGLARRHDSQHLTRPGRTRSPLAAYEDNYEWHQGDSRDSADEDEGVYVATCIPGLSTILAEELSAIGSRQVETTGNAAVRFTANTETAMRALIWCRTPHKIMELLCESPPIIKTRDDIYEFVRETVPVKNLVGNGKGGLLTLSVSTLLNNPSKLPKDINHSHYTALTVKNAICDEVRDMRGDRPDVSTDNPDLPLVAVVRGMSSGGRGKQGGGGGRGGEELNTPQAAQFSLFRQIHHGSLHRRGYRSTIHKAAMKESLAAGLLLNAEWHKTCRAHREQQQDQASESLVLIDPMAGSGTLLLEGLFIAANVAPHVLRLKCGLEPASANQFPPITRWKHGDVNVEQLWKGLLLEASQQAKNGLRYLKGENNERPIYFVANDYFGGALDLLDESLQAAGVNELINIQESDCRELVPQLPQGVSPTTPWNVVCNPPWGVRLTDEIEESWESLRVFLRETCPEGTMAHVLSGNAKATKHLGLRRSASLPIQVGTVQMRWIQYLMQKPEERRRDAVNASLQSSASRRPSTGWNTRRGPEFSPRSRRTESFSRGRRQGLSGPGQRPGAGSSRSERKPKPKKKKVATIPSEEVNEWLID